VGLTVGQIGAGAVAPWHMQGYVASPHVDRVVLAEPDEQAAAALYDRFGIIKAVEDDYSRLLDSAEISIIDICTPNDLHAEMAIAALEKGLHVICEQPPATEMADFDAMVASADSSNGRLFICNSQAMIPANEKTGELIRDGELGEVLLATSLVMEEWRERIKEPDDWYGNSKRGGDALMRSGYGAVATLQRWLGPAVSVSATRRRTTDRSDDSVLVNMEMAGGALAQIAITHAASGDAPTHERRIVGTGGSLLARDDPDDEMPLVTFDQGMFFPLGIHNPPAIREYAMKRLLCHFVECIINEEEPLVTVEEAGSALRTVLGARESLTTGACVEML